MITIKLRLPFAGEPQFSSAAHPLDAGGRNLGWKAVGHHPTVVDADLFPALEAAGLVGVDLDLLAGAAVAHQQIAGTDLLNDSANGHGRPSFFLDSPHAMLEEVEGCCRSA
jgi:hypothetical protein